VLSPFVAANGAATAGLRGRPLFEYCPLLLGGLIAPLTTQFQITADRGGRVMYRQVVQRETPQVNQLVMIDNVALPMRASARPDDFPVAHVAGRVALPMRALGSPNATRGGLEAAVLGREVQQAEFTAFQNAAEAINLQANSANANAAANNRRIIAVLEQATGQQLGADPARWWEWWQDYNQKWWPQVSQFVYDQQQHFYGFTNPSPQARHSCFVAGTLVRTESGLAPIESIQPGDRVLAQDQDTGELAYKLVATRTLRPPGKLLRIRVGDQNVNTTLGHPFWVSGHGWRMAKELKTGDLLHSLAGSLPIDAIESLPDPQPAYNLVVPGFNTYFVTQTGLLVHDNEFRKPTRAIVPGLMPDDVPPAK
jgi:hypothetical protein